jgi:NADH-quinone oxidoreductase subunit L
MLSRMLDVGCWMLDFRFQPIRSLPWLILFLPLLAAAVITLFTLRCRTVSALLSIGAIVAGFVLTIVFIAANGFHPAARRSAVNWLSIGNLHIDFGLKLDALSLMMMLIVTGVGGAIHIYSFGYMREDRGFSRFFACMSLFTFSMLGIVLANNFIEMFIFWELVGVSSYLLIGFWFEKPSAADAAKKAFFTNRLGDFGFPARHPGGVGGARFAEFQHASKTLVANPAALGTIASVAGLLIFCGAMGKSAQFPLHVWLPDAMEGPTPVSALIHAATMVAAGVYMLCRICFPAQRRRAARHRLHRRIHRAARRADRRPAKRHQAHPRLLDAVATRLHGHGRRLERPDAGDVPFDHARVFQGAAVPGAGSVIIAMHHEQDIWKMGNLRRKCRHVLDVPHRHAGLVRRAAVQRFLFEGFHSRAGAGTEKLPALWRRVFVAALTAFYMFRLVLRRFLRQRRNPKPLRTRTNRRWS